MKFEFFQIFGIFAENRAQRYTLSTFKNDFLQIIYYGSIRFLTERGDNIWWFDGQRINFRSASTSKILNLMRSIPDITIADLSGKVGINTAAVNKQIRQLTDKGYIQRSANGDWRLVITPSV